MKRLLSFLLASATVATLLAGCGGNTTTSSAASPATPGSSAPASSTAGDAAAPTGSWQDKGTPLADVRVRQALAYAIDIKTITEQLFKGKAEVATSLTSPGDWLATGLTDYSYDVEKAKALLAEAGWPADYTLDVVYYYDDQQTVDLMTVIGQYWQQVGVKAQFRKLEGDLPSQLWVAPADKVNGPSAVKWDIAYGAIAALAEHEFYDRFKSTATNNSTVPMQEGLDALIDATSATADVQAQIAAFHEVQKVMNANELVIPLYHQVAFIYNSDKIDMKGNVPGNEQFTYQNNVIDWTTTREDKTLYTNGGALEFFSYPAVNPGQFIYQDLVFERLINADAALSPTDGNLAQEYKFSDDQKTLEFTLRPDAKWQDGEPLTADDVKFTIELYLKAPGLNAIAASTFEAMAGAQDFKDGKADNISGIVAAGDKVTITFDKIAPNALLTFSQWPILPKHLLATTQPEKFQQDQYWQKPIGSGPFMVDEVQLGSYSTLKRWDAYYKKGEGNIEKIYMSASNENDSNLVKNAEGGKIDYAWSKSTDDAQAMEAITGMTVTPAKIRYTRLFYINQYPHDANIK